MLLLKKNLDGQITNPCDLLVRSLLLAGMSCTEKHLRIEATVDKRAFTCNQTRGQLKAYRNGENVILDPLDGT